MITSTLKSPEEEQHVLAAPQDQEKQLADNVWRAFPTGTDQGKEHPDDGAERNPFPHARASGRSLRLDARVDVPEAEVVGLLGQGKAQSLAEFWCHAGLGRRLGRPREAIGLREPEEYCRLSGEAVSCSIL